MRFKDFIKRRGVAYRIFVFCTQKLIAIIVWTSRKKIVGEEFHKEKKAFLLFWHNRSIMVPYFLREDMMRESHALASASGDGQVIADYLKRWGASMIYGSYGKKDAVSATRDLIHSINSSQKKGYTALAIDGPTGPIYQYKEGLARALLLVKAPVYIMSINCSKKITFNKAWDKFQMPLPFGTMECVFKKIPAEQLTKSRKNELEKVIDFLNRETMKITKD